MNRVLVVDDHPLVALIMLEQARAAFPGAQVASAGSVAEAIASEGVDLVMLDLGLPGCAGIEALTRMRAAHPEARVVVVSAADERAVILAALDAGAAGYIPKTSRPGVVTAALRLVAEGGVYLPPEVLEGACPVVEDVGLTCRQLEVLQDIAHGFANKEIAQRMGISEDTVKQHAKAVFAALRVKSRSQAGRAAERRGIKLVR